MFFDPSSGRFAWTPVSSQAGQFDIAFTAISSAAAAATGHVLIEVGSGKPLISVRFREPCVLETARLYFGKRYTPASLLCGSFAAAPLHCR